MTDAPEIPPEMLDEILRDPEAVAAMQELAGRAGITTPVAEMGREEQTALITTMLGLAQQSGTAVGADGQPLAGPSHVPQELIDQVFSDPRADPMLRDIISHNQLTGEPADQPADVKEAIVRMLVDQGVISFSDNDTN